MSRHGLALSFCSFKLTGLWKHLCHIVNGMVLKTTDASMSFVNRQVLTDSQWMSFMEWKEFSREAGNANVEWIGFVWNRKANCRYRQGVQQQLIIVGLTWA